MARERANTEALLVLLLEMFVFLGFCFGVQAAIRESDEQPTLVTAVVVGLALCTAVMALAAAVNEFSDDDTVSQSVVFVLVRAAWHVSLACSMNAKTFVTLVVMANDAQHRNWSLLLLQTQTHAMENRYFTAAQNAWVLSVASVVVLMHAVFYSKANRGTEQRNVDVGRLTTMWAFFVLLVQYSTETALGRLCAVGPLDDAERPDEVESCELPLVADNLDADYGALWLLLLLLAVLLASDVVVCVLHAKLLRSDPHSDLQAVRSLALELLHAVCALVPCAAFLVFAAAALEYTTPAHLAYLVAVWLALAFSCCRRVWTALSRRKQHLAGHPQAGALDVVDVVDVPSAVFEQDAPHPTHPTHPTHQPHQAHGAAPHKTHSAVAGIHFDGVRSAILRGTSQVGSRFSEHKKQQ